MTKKRFPEFVPPMMAESAKAPFDAPDWMFEIKLDGYRAITVFDADGKPHLWSRNGFVVRNEISGDRFGGVQIEAALDHSRR